MPARPIPKFNHLHTFKASGSGKEEAKRAEDSKSKSSQSDQDYRKKRNALEGKDSKEAKGDRGEDSKGKTQGTPDGKSGGSHSKQQGSRPQTSLQSNQVTVQFSTGGGIGAGGNIGSLLSLLASSSNLVRADGGSILNTSNQASNLSLQYTIRGQASQTGSLTGGELRHIKAATSVSLDQAGGVQPLKFNLEMGGAQSTQSSNALQNVFSNILKGISAQANEIDNSAATTIPPTIFSMGGSITTYVGFNFSSFFFSSPISPFVFSNTTATSVLVTGSDGTPLGFRLSNDNAGTITNYFNSAGLGSPGNFTYKVLGPILAPNGELVQQPIDQPFGVSVAKQEGDLSFNISGAPEVVTDQTSGLTLSSTGDLYANVENPISVLIAATAGSTTLPVRINVGPGDLLTSPNTVGFFYADSPDNTLSGYTKLNSDEFASTVFNASGNYTIIGNGAAFMLNSPGAILGNTFYTVALDAFGNNQETPVALGALDNFIYTKGIANVAFGGVDVGSFAINGTYDFPSNTIFRHVGTSLDGENPVPTEAAYGNFASYVNQDFLRINVPAVTESTLTFLPTSSYNLTLGGNVLDVFGTKYGVGDVLNVNLPSASGFAPPANTITMGGNTLAGFGTSYGDLQTLRVFAQPGDGVTEQGATNLTFTGNVLAVDKNIGSVLYPHLQTLDLEQSSGTSPVSPSNVHVVFHNSIITGNQGSDTFYGDVVNLGDLNNPGRYNGFITGVNSDTSQDSSNNTVGQLVITTQTGNNTITYGNNIYTGGNTLANPLAVDTYNFTIVGDTGGQPIMQGNALITDFNLTKDVLNLNLTQEVFKALVGAASREHIKQVTVADLDTAASFTQWLNQTDLTIDPLFSQYLLQMATSSTAPSGSTVSFDAGGSLSFAGGNVVDSFSDISNLNINVDFTYVPVAALPLSEVAASTPRQTEPFVYGIGINNRQDNPYYNELDNFFANSIFAAYTVTSSPGGINPGVTAAVTPTQVTTFGSTYLQDAATTVLTPSNPLDTSPTAEPGNVIIDPFGTITATNKVPILQNLTITATDQQGNTDTTSGLFGFLEGIITPAATNPISSPNPITTTGTSSSNILVGGAGSIIVGERIGGPDYVFSRSGTSGLPFSFPDPQNLGGNLIVATPGASDPGATAYGGFKAVSLSAEGASGVTYTPSNAQTLGAGVFGGETAGDGNTLNFFSNALAVNGIAYGVAGTFTINALGGDNSTVALRRFTPSTLPSSFDNSGDFAFNEINFGSQTLYGHGTLYGVLDTFTINIAAGSGNSFDLKGAHKLSEFSTPTVLDASGYVQDNTFTFLPSYITVYGDTASQASTVYGSVNSLSILAKDVFSKSLGENLIVQQSAVFKDNAFVFGDNVLKGGNGTVNYYGDLHTFGDPYGYTATNPIYNGFVKGVTVTYSPNGSGGQAMTITDSGNNSITWGNDTYIGGEASSSRNIYNFTIVEDQAGNAIMQGFDTITNFNPTRDTIVFNVEANLFKRLGMDQVNPSDMIGLASKLDPDLAISNQSSHTKISFLGGGSLDLKDWGLEVSNLAQLVQAYQSSVQVKQLGTPYTAPTFNTAAPFDPVFVNVVQTGAFAGFVATGDPSTLTYQVSGLTLTTDPLTQAQYYDLGDGVIVHPNGTLSTANVGVNNPVDKTFSLVISDGLTSSAPLSLHIFAINATDGIIHRDTDPVVKGSTYSGTDTTASHAFETATPGNKVIGSGDDIVFNAQNPTTPAAPLVYGSNLIYDVSGGTHTAVGNVEHISFTNDGTIPTATLNGQAVIFHNNLFNVPASSGSYIYGNTMSITLSASGGISGSAPVDSAINNNSFSFGANTIFGSGTVYGNVQNLSLVLDDPSTLTPLTIGNGSITGNTFIFNGVNPNYLNTSNVLTSQSSATSLYPGIGTLTIENRETGAFTRAGESQIANNSFQFGNSILVAGNVATDFYGDIANLSNTNFVIQPVTLGPNATAGQSGVVEVQDSQGNTIAWGNNKYIGNANTTPDSYTFTLLDRLSGGTSKAIMQGNATIQNFNASWDTLNFQLSPGLFRQLATNFDRTVSGNQLSAAFTTAFITGGIILTFSGGGSIAFEGLSLDTHNFNASLAYTPERITVADLSPQPLILTSIGGNNGGSTYGNILDTYFNHVDIGNTGSTYTVTSAFPQSPLAVPNTIFDGYGTASLTTPTTSPALYRVTVAPNDVWFADNHPKLSLTVGMFNPAGGGYIPDDPNTGPGGMFVGSATMPSLLQGKFGGETLIGNQTIAGGSNGGILNIAPTSSTTNQTSLVYGINQFGNNMIINTNPGNTAYGDFQSINFNLQGSFNGFTATVPSVIGNRYDFGSNALDVTGTTYGIADTYNVGVDGVDGVTNSLIFSNLNHSVNFSNNQVNFGPQTIFGQGTVYGDLNAMNFNILGGENGSSAPGAFLDVSANVVNNTFEFGPNVIVVTGNNPSSLYPGIGSLKVFQEDGIPSSSFFNPGTVNDSATFTGNKFIFGDSLVISGSGATHFYGDIADLSQTDFVTQPVTLGPDASSGTSGVVQVEDDQGNSITWGNNDYVIGGEQLVDGPADFTFTLLQLQGAQGSPAAAAMQGNATIENFNLGRDALGLDIPESLFQAINANHDRSISNAELGAIATLSPDGAGTTVSFAAGSISFLDLPISNLNNFNNLSVGLVYTENPSPIAVALTAPTQPVIFNQAPGSQYNLLDAWFDNIDIANTGSTYTVTSMFPDIPYVSALTIDQYGTVTASGTPTPKLSYVTITPNDPHFSGNIVNLPVMVGVFNGPSEADPNGGPGGTFIGSRTTGQLLQGNYADETMIGNDLNFNVNATSSITDQTTLVYGTNKFGNNMIINTNEGNTAYGDFQSINFNVQSSFNGIGANTPNVTGNKYDFGSNAFDVTGRVYGIAGTYSVTVQGINSVLNSNISGTLNKSVSFSNNTTDFGSQTIFGQGTLYGDLGAMNFNVFGGDGGTSSFAGSTLNVGANITGNTFTFGSNHIAVIGNDASSLYSGIGRLSITQEDGTPSIFNLGTVNDDAIFSGNKFIFGDSSTTGGTGITSFYGETDLSGTSFYNSAVTANAFNGDVHITDSALNMVHFGNDVMTGNSTGTSVYNINLFATTDGNLVADGHTTINNFAEVGPSNHNMLNLNLSEALYQEISAANNGATTITGSMLDTYMAAHNASIAPDGNNSVANFSDGSGNSLGSITLTGINIPSFASLGSNLQVTARGVTTIDPEVASPGNVYNITLPGDTISSFTQNTHVIDFTDLGHIVDFGGFVRLNMSDSLYNALGLSDSNTHAQNAQILKQAANTATGGVSISEQTTGTGEGAVTNTTLTFQTNNNGTVSAYGSVTLHDTQFSLLNPIENHLLITHT